MDIREKIIKSALELFVERGFYATPTSEITRNAGVSTGILFRYFPTKENLIITLYTEFISEFYHVGIYAVREPYPPNVESFRDNLRLAWESQWRWGLDNWQKIQFIQQFQNAPFNRKLKIEDVEELNRLWQILKDYFQRGMDMGFIRNAPVMLLISHGAAMVFTLIRFLYGHRELRDDKEFIEQAFQMVWSSIKK